MCITIGLNNRTPVTFDIEKHFCIIFTAPSHYFENYKDSHLLLKLNYLVCPNCTPLYKKFIISLNY